MTTDAAARICVNCQTAFTDENEPCYAHPEATADYPVFHTASGGGLFDGAPIISSYSRAQALEDGVLVDVSEMAREAGFTCPVALTRAAWEDCVAWADEERALQDESGRLWDVLMMAFYAIKRHQGAASDRLTYELLRIPRGEMRARRTTLALVAGPGDTPEMVLTLMLPGED